DQEDPSMVSADFLPHNPVVLSTLSAEPGRAAGLGRQANARELAGVADVELAVGVSWEAPSVTADLKTGEFGVFFGIGFEEEELAVFGEHEKLFANHNRGCVILLALAEAGLRPFCFSSGGVDANVILVWALRIQVAINENRSRQVYFCVFVDPCFASGDAAGVFGDYETGDAEGVGIDGNVIVKYDWARSVTLCVGFEWDTPKDFSGGGVRAQKCVSVERDHLANPGECGHHQRRIRRLVIAGFPEHLAGFFVERDE